MRDIVATVQREQDEVIRAPLQGVLVVQGGPGTGKTAVALHRAAYLLYTHRFPLERQGVLVVGPNPVFLRYIDHVLPSLGETGVVLASIAGVVNGPHIRGVDPPDAARVKGDARMVQVPARALRDRERAVEDRHDGAVRGAAAAVDRGRQRVARRQRPPPARHPQRRRRQLETLVLRRLIAQLGDIPVDERADVTEGMRDVPQFEEAMERMWPVLTPEELLHDLFGSHALIKSAGRDILSADEQRALHRPRSSHVEDIEWTKADIALFDEARGLVGPAPAASRRHDGPRLRSHRGRRGAGPVADGAAGARPAFVVGLDDGGRRHRPGHRPLGPAVVGRGRRAPPRRSRRRAYHRAQRQLPHAE